MSRLAGKVTLITGAGRGIGHGIALGYAREGADLVLVSRTEAEIAAVAKEVEALGREALPAVADVRDAAAVRSVVEQALRTFGRIDVLVNAAGIPMVAPSAELPLEDWQRTIDINLTGTFLCCQAVGRTMIAQGHGAISTSARYSRSRASRNASPTRRAKAGSCSSPRRWRSNGRRWGCG
jgi:NAD(P)-dependent dehydrogenase (short-subunit alcohol dehydrogenase family)